MKKNNCEYKTYRRIFVDKRDRNWILTFITEIVCNKNNSLDYVVTQRLPIVDNYQTAEFYASIYGRLEDVEMRRRYIKCKNV